ncbi:hypothetical protein RXV86_01765 [Alisedimentitalea sp. MJ-SS2]|uniref:hypothetical protein n=1 Tax=Aliisedimentitalea sp. MJ-SS2 TaxID=3049795 RepID=UPI00290D8663|nr:hypothetical protein [Alisedimentitalea sp. MJ-SS2]MDU8926104.1 hypothetical protein [Alisedimentitalea sp. MJ-SS2]
MRRIIILGLVLFASVVRADYFEPKRGSEMRQALMDALRPHAEWLLGAPALFVISELRVATKKDLGLPFDVAFAVVEARRPDGSEINLWETPGVERGDLDPHSMDGATFQVLYRREGKMWVAVHWEIGALDAWFTDTIYCPDYFAVIPEVCAG